MKNEKIHSTLLALVGAYILYIAYQLFEKYRSGTGEMPDAVFIIAIVVFVLGGLGTMYYAWNVYSKWKKSEAADKSDREEDNN